MYINWILKSRNPQNSNLVRKNREDNYFSSRTKLEVLRYVVKFDYAIASITRQQAKNISNETVSKR